MTKRLTLLLALVAFCCLASTAAAKPPGNKWRLAFADEFNGRSIDHSKWATLTGWRNNNVVTQGRRCSVDGHGHLVLALGCLVGSIPPDVGPNGYGMRIGDYVEARIWFPGPGKKPTGQIDNWPAMFAVGRNWRKDGEVDVAEGTNGLTINYHSGFLNENSNAPMPGPYGNSWHTYAVYRGAGYDAIYYDGALMWKWLTEDSGKPQSIMFISGATGPTSPADYCCGGPINYKARVLVDWVHAWRYQK